MRAAIRIRRVLPWLVAALATLVLALPGAPASSTVPKIRVKNTNGYIAGIAMDGPLLAYDVKAALQGPTCNRLFLWNVSTNAGALVSGKETCEADDSSTGAGVSDIAVAGNRVAWIVNVGGNTESIDTLYTAALPKPREARIATAQRRGDVDCIVEGPNIGGLVGDGDLLSVNMWREVAADESQCETKVVAASLRVLRGTTPRRIAAGPETLVAQSADSGRIAVRRADDTVAVYARTGRVLRVFSPSSIKEVALEGNRLVILTTTSTLEIFDTRMGALLHTRRVPHGAAHLDVQSGIAVYAAGRRVLGMELATGMSVVLATAPRDVLALALEAAGAAYAYDSPYTRAKDEIGNVAFLPAARLHAVLS